MRSEPPSPAGAESPDPYPFTPVPLQRIRRAGWTAERQRQFIAALARLGSVGAAAQAVGISARSAHKLRERPGAESFAAAWDGALEDGLHERRAALFERATQGTVVPRYRNGRVVGLVHSFDLRSAIAILSARGTQLVARREEAARVRAYRAGLKKAEERRLAARPAPPPPPPPPLPPEEPGGSGASACDNPAPAPEDEAARQRRLEAELFREARERANALRIERESGRISMEEAIRRERRDLDHYEAERRRRGLPPCSWD